MRNILSAVLGVFVLALAAPFGRALDNTWEFSVQVSAAVQSSPAQITLNWLQDTYTTPSSYTVYRRAPGAGSWGTGTALPGTATSYVDNNVAAGTPYEYQIVKQTSFYPGYGYIYAGIDVPMTENRGKLLLVVDNTYAANLTNELARLQQDLVGDGWTVTRIDVGRNDSAASVKSLIKAQYDADAANVKAVFLFGHVPVPYSGNIVPDGHAPDHRGAWPCDAYYGEMDGNWTDDSVNITGATDARNRNVPGDGKFDQTDIPSPLELMVGRVDLANMPGRLTWGGPATFPSELELLRNYLNKDHNFRHKAFELPRRGIVGDYFGVRDGEAFAASGWRNFGPLVNPTNVTFLPNKGTWVPTLNTNAYLWAYGCGSGSYTSVGGLGNTGVYNDGITAEVYQNDIKAIFTLLFGSWFGDWDNEDNIQRSVLALPTYGLTCAWSGRPHWFLHHMALGETIGFGARLTQNNSQGGLYRNQVNSCAGQIHIALMGDPTLRMHPVAPPSALTSTLNGSSVSLNWAASTDTVAGYHVYRATNPNGPFTRLTSSLLTSPSYTDTSVSGNYTYMVRAVKLENSPSGSYYNPSQGAFASGSGTSVAGSDTTAPTVTLTAPAANSTVTGASVTVSANASDDVGVAGVQFKLDGVNLGTELTSAPYSMTWNATTASTGAHVLTATGRDAAGNQAMSLPVSITVADSTTSSVIWFDDAPPAGAVLASDGGDPWFWNWVSNNPAPFSGSVAHQSELIAGFHQHYFNGATQTFGIGSGETLYTYVYLDPANPPSELMLQWNNGNWDHRAYWGANSLNFGTDNTGSRRYIGALPQAGQWTRLEVPASEVGLEGSTLVGMAFTLYGGKATWDVTGKISVSVTNTPPDTNTPPVSTNALPGSTVVDYIDMQMPMPGTNALHVLTPTLLELKLINTKQADPARVTEWDFVDSNFQFTAPPLSDLAVTADGQPVSVAGVGFKRRPLYAPIVARDLRIENSLYVQLASPISDGQVVEVKNPSGALWGTSMKFIVTADPFRFSPAIHVNQEGYLPNYQKKAMVGYYAGSFGEMNFYSASGFRLVDASTGATVYQGQFASRPDVGYTYAPTPYQKVYEADFTSFNTPGRYRLAVPGLGASLPFLIDEGIAMSFARAYALGLYHQRCGTNNALPYTRFAHDVCHATPASVPVSTAAFPFTWTTVSNYALINNPDNPAQTAPRLVSPAAQLFPFVRQGVMDVSGGHHDAGDYSKYTLNSVALIHYLMFAVDSIPGIADLDNLGIPESGDGISDVMQEAKWEADFLAKMQDTDGGFYFLVYPQNREYEGDVTPDHGDPQVVWPKTSSATAASVAALAQCASSPAFKQAYPATAALYLQKAQLGWQFLTNAIAMYGKNGIYQKITHYGDHFEDKDELAWAACEMFLATGNPHYQQTLFQWFPDPANAATFRWGWWRLFLSYGNAVRSYAFAARSGRLQPSQLDANYLAKCMTTVTNAGNDMLTWSQQSAYGTSFPEETKHVKAAGWYFSGDQAYDLAVAYQLSPRPEFINAILANMNYEGGCNPVNVSYVTGLGQKRQHEVVSQYALNDRRVLAPSGIPIGNLQSAFGYLENYKSELVNLCFPSDNAPTAMYPIYDRWADAWNVSTEFVTFEQARSLVSYAFIAAQGSLKTQAWQAHAAQIVVPTDVVETALPVTVTLQAPGVDLTGARVVWEVRDQEPAFGSATFTYSPKANGTQWIEAEATLADGRRVFATATFNTDSPTFVWADDALPAGSTSNVEGGDAWAWVNVPTPYSGSLAHQSAISAGLHQHYFDNAAGTMSVSTGDVMYAYVYLDPANPPSEVMLQWNNGNWDHRAYWGANLITGSYGTDGTASRRHMGPLPAPGQWVRLEVRASQVGLEGSTVKGMAFTLYGGRATWDVAGRVSLSTPLLPTVSVTATSTNASRIGPVSGVFTFTRAGDTNSALTVSYTLGGTATNGADYSLAQAGLATSISIPAGATSSTLTLTPISTTNVVGQQTVVVTLATNTNYSVGTSGAATLSVGGNMVPVALKFTGNKATLTWLSTSGAVYRVGYKNSLSDTTWTMASGVITATGNTSSWIDTEASNRHQRYYVVIRVL